jgi:DNA modification methylase
MGELITWTNCKVRLGDLKKWDENPAEINKESAARLVESFNEFGQVQALAIDPDYRLIDGHQRLDVWLEKFGPDFQADCRMSSRTFTLRERQKVAVFLRSAAVGQYNWDKLANWDPIDLKDWGFDNKTLNAWQKDAGALKDFIEAQEPDVQDAEPKVDQAAELLKKWKVEIGDLWQIGIHRLYAGDATDPESFTRLLGEEKADLVFTDPPYGVSYIGGARPDEDKWKPLENDNLRGLAFQEFLAKAFTNMHAGTKENTALYCFHASRNQIEFESALKESGYQVRQQLIWNKGMVLGRSDYHWTHEPCFYCGKIGGKTEWYGDRSQKTVLGKRRSAFENLTREKLLAIVMLLAENTTCWEIDRDAVTEYQHSTQKPTRLALKGIMNSSPEGGIVLDPFAGSGSTMVAAENAGRACRAMELEPGYCAVILQRMQDAFLGIEISRIVKGIGHMTEEVGQG